MTILVSTGLRNHMLDSGSFKSAMDDGILEIYDNSGGIPASPDDAVTGNLLFSITDNSQAIAPGNGLDFEAAATGDVLSKLAGQTWSGVCGIAGVTAYYRLVEYADRNGTGGGASTTAKRVQGIVGVAGADLNLSNLSYLVSDILAIAEYQIKFPE